MKITKIFMKKITLIFMLMSVVFLGFSQELKIVDIMDDATVLENAANLNLKIIVNTGTLFGGASYQFADGEKLKTMDALKTVAIVPENASVLKQEKAWKIASFILAGVSVAAIGVNCASLFIDNEDFSRIARPVSEGTLLIALPFSLFCGEVSSLKRQKAVDNYNLKIMGIPIN